MDPTPAAERERLITRPFLLVAGATMALFASFASLLPVLPRYADGPLDAGGVGVGLSIGSASVTALLFLPRMGRLADRHSRRTILLAGALLVAVTDASLVLATNLPAVVGIRLLSGIGEAAVFAAAIAVVNDLAPEHRRGEAVSLFTVASYSGLAIGPLLGEAALGDGRYEAVWLVAAGCAAVAACSPFGCPIRGRPATSHRRAEAGSSTARRSFRG